MRFLIMLHQRYVKLVKCFRRFFSRKHREQKKEMAWFSFKPMNVSEEERREIMESDMNSMEKLCKLYRVSFGDGELPPELSE